MTSSISQRNATSDGRRPGGWGNAMLGGRRRQYGYEISAFHVIVEMSTCQQNPVADNEDGAVGGGERDTNTRE